MKFRRQGANCAAEFCFTVIFSGGNNAAVTLGLFYLYLQQLHDSGTAHAPDCLAVLLARGTAHTACLRLSSALEGHSLSLIHI